MTYKAQPMMDTVTRAQPYLVEKRPVSLLRSLDTDYALYFVDHFFK